MKRMFAVLSVSALTLLPVSTAFTCSEKEVASACNMYYPRCFWEYSSGYCVDVCESHTTSEECNKNSQDCGWVGTDGGCVWVVNSPSRCITLTTQSECQSPDRTCHWNVIKCSDADCAGITNEATCRDYPTQCFWDKNVCKTDLGFTQTCTQQANKIDCLDMHCYWDSTTFSCLSLNCGAIGSNKDECDMYPNQCKWDSDTLQCSSGPSISVSACYRETSERDCIHKNPQCVWNNGECSYLVCSDFERSNCIENQPRCKWLGTECAADPAPACIYQDTKESCESSSLACTWSGVRCEYVNCNMMLGYECLSSQHCTWSNDFCVTAAAVVTPSPFFKEASEGLATFVIVIIVIAVLIVIGVIACIVCCCCMGANAVRNKSGANLGEQDMHPYQSQEDGTA